MTSPSPQLSGSLVADTSAGAYCARSTDGMEDVEELWDLLAQKDSDLRHAAELGTVYSGVYENEDIFPFGC